MISQEIPQYCVCKTPADECDDRFMIQCDLCENWFHGECIKLSEDRSDLVDEFICPSCEQSTKRKTSWKPECIVCSKYKARENSKFCSDACGIRQARKILSSGKIKIVESSITDNSDQMSPKNFNPTEQRLLNRRDDLIQRKSLIRSAVLLANLIQYKSGKDICCYDSRLSNLFDSGFSEDWSANVDGNLSDQYPTICLQEKCQIHQASSAKSSLDFKNRPKNYPSEIDIQIPSWAHLLQSSVDVELEIIERYSLNQLRNQLKRSLDISATEKLTSCQMVVDNQTVNIVRTSNGLSCGFVCLNTN